MAELSSKKAEQKVLALFLQSPIHVRSLSINMDVFAYKAHKNLASLIKKYVRKYKSVPTKDTLISFSNTQLTEDNISNMAEALEVIDTLPVAKVEEANYYFKQLENCYVGRNICDVYDLIKNNLEQPVVDFVDLRQDIIKQTLLMRGCDDGGIQRGFIYNTINKRFHKYEASEAGKSGDLIPFGMTALDNAIGGMKKSFVTLLYSGTSVGKSRFAINVAYNNAVIGNNVMYVSLEMDYDILGNCFDSRIAAIDSREIIFGKLVNEDKIKFAQALKQQAKDKLNIWISDIPMGATMARIFEEIEIYMSVNGFSPDLLIIDYANLLTPTGRYNDRSSKFDELLKEIHETARFYNVSLMTMMQESREASKDYIKKMEAGKEISSGVHNIGASNFAAIHCENVLRLMQNKEDKIRNRMYAGIDKSRYGSNTHDRIELYCCHALTYIGDRTNTIVYRDN